MTSGEVVNPSFKVDEFLPKTIEDIPKDMLNNLPEDIKKVFFFCIWLQISCVLLNDMVFCTRYGVHGL